MMGILYKVEQDYFAHAIGKAMFCQCCDKTLDAPTAAVATFTSPIDTMTVVGCGSCIDNLVAGVERRKVDCKVEVWDGRKIFHPVLEGI